jgi:hypothetical protein
MRSCRSAGSAARTASTGPSWSSGAARTRPATSSAPSCTSTAFRPGSPGRGRHAIRLDCQVERGDELTVPRSALPALPEGEFYTFELVGLRVEEEGGREIGVVRDVLPGPANDNLQLEDGRLVPMIEDAILSVDPAGGRVLLNPGFTD